MKISIPVLALFLCAVSCGAPADDADDEIVETSQALKVGKPQKVGGQKSDKDKKEKKPKKDKKPKHDDCGGGGRGGMSGSGGTSGSGGSGGTSGSGGGGACAPEIDEPCGCFDRESGTQPGRISCDGQCVAPPQPIFDECDECGGTVFCDGSCSIGIPAEIGQACNVCGGTVQCDGTCNPPCPE